MQFEVQFLMSGGVLILWEHTTITNSQLQSNVVLFQPAHTSTQYPISHLYLTYCDGSLRCHGSLKIEQNESI